MKGFEVEWSQSAGRAAAAKLRGFFVTAAGASGPENAALPARFPPALEVLEARAAG